MAFPLLSHSRSDSPLLFLLDIGDSFMKSAQIRQGKESLDILSLSHKKTDALSWKKDVERMRESAMAHYGKPDAVLLSFPPTIFRAKLVEYVLARKRSGPISDREAKTLEKEMESKAEEDIKEYFSRVLGITPAELVVPRVSVLERKANGYAIEDFRGIAAEQLLVRYLGTCIPRRYTDEIAGIPDVSLVHMAEGAARFFPGVRGDSAFIDMGESMTHVAMVRQGTLLSFQEFKGGAKYFTHYLERILGMQDASARDLKERYAQGEFSQPLRAKLHSAFLRESERWATLCVETLCSGERVLGSRIFLSGGGSLLPEVQSVLREKLREALGEHVTISSFTPSLCAKNDKFPGSGNPLYTPMLLLPYALK
ncbi:MAG: hypothetical protein Q8P39_00705 [Candidatus Yanofskybacteria bacterium]|nr:hypothetical protein [Candidatus Yanofskybacteria bacterium]